MERIGTPLESASQNLPQFIDDGAESTSVDLLTSAEEGGNQGNSAPAKDDDESVLPVKPEDSETTEGEVKPTGTEKTDLTEKTDSHGVQKRLNVMTKKIKDQERATAAAVKETAEANEKLAKFEAKQAETDLGEEPDVDDFDTAQEHTNALVAWKVKHELFKHNAATAKVNAEAKVKADAKAAEEANESAADTQAEAVYDAIYKTADKYPDFDEKVKTVELPIAMQDVFTEIDNATDVAYHLAENPDLVEKLSEFSTAVAANKITKLSQSLKTKKTTDAPNPIKTVTTSGGNIKTLGELSTKEYRERREKELAD